MSDQPPTPPEAADSTEPAEPTAVAEHAEPTPEPGESAPEESVEVDESVGDESVGDESVGDGATLPTTEESVVAVFAGGGDTVAPDTDRLPAQPARRSGRERRLLPWWIFAAAVFALVVVAIVLVLAGDAGSDTPTGVAEAGDAVAAAIADVGLTDAEAADIDCPVDLTTVVARLPAPDAARELTGVGEFSAVLAPSTATVQLVECSFESDGERDIVQLAGVSLGVPPDADDFESTMKGFLSRHVLTFEEPREWRGGTVFAYCGEPTAVAADAGFDPFCEVDWVHPQLVVGVFASPDVLTAAQVGEWLESTVDMIVQQLAAG